MQEYQLQCATLFSLTIKGRGAHQHAEVAASLASTLVELVCQLASGEATGQLLNPVLREAILWAALAPV